MKKEYDAKHKAILFKKEKLVILIFHNGSTTRIILSRKLDLSSSFHDKRQHLSYDHIKNLKCLRLTSTSVRGMRTVFSALHPIGYTIAAIQGQLYDAWAYAIMHEASILGTLRENTDGSEISPHVGHLRSGMFATEEAEE